MKTVKLNAFDNPFVYGVNNKEYLVFNIDNETQTLKFQSLIGDLKVKTANILFKANSLPAKLYEMVVDDDILTFTLPSVLTGYNSSMYVYLLLNYSDDLSTSDLYTFKLADKGSSTFNFEISSICESNISTIVSEEIKNERVAKSILDTVSNYEFDKLQHAQQSLSLVENAFSSTLEKRIDLFNSAYDKANATKSNTTGDINASDINIPGSNTDSDLRDYVENVKEKMAERLKDVTAVSEQIQDEMTQEKQSFLGDSLIFQQDLKQERDTISAYGESTRQHMDHEFNEVKDYADKVFVDFSKEIPDLDASIRQVNDKIVDTDNKVGTLNTKVTTVETEIAELEKMHDEVTQTINKGKPISLYSNSLDFPQGDYDYSGNPNLVSPISFASLSRFKDKTDTNIPGVTDGGSYFEVNTEVSLASGVSSVFVPFQPRLQPSKTYTLTVSIEYDQDFIDRGAGHSISYGSTIKGVIERPVTIIGAKTTTAKQTISTTFNTSAIYGNGQAESFFQLWFTSTSKGKIKVYYDFKLEEGSKATPYQPNLLDAPYYIGKHEVNKNIANPDVVFPINTNAYKIYEGNILEDFSTSKKYTLTIKGTKLGSQQFTAYIGGSQLLAQLLPVEGLTDVWSATFKPQNVPSAVSKLLQIYQVPSTTVGAVRIDWVKLEVSEYRTPPIKAYKYKGVSLRNTIDPKAFDWQEQTVTDVSKLKEQVNTLTPKVDNSQVFKLTNDNGNAIKVDYMNPKPTSFLALAKNTGFYSISTAESKLMSDYNELPSLLQNTFLFINNYPPRDGFILQEITGGEISTQLVHKYYRRIEPDNTYKNWNKVITDKDVSKMKTLYSNCIDFGNYDYSGNPNLMKNVTNSSWTAEGAMNISATDDYFTATKTATNQYGSAVVYDVPALLSNSQYTLSLEINLQSGSTGDLRNCNIAVEGTYTNGQVYYGVINLSDITETDKWINVSNTFTTNTYTSDITNFKFRIYISPESAVNIKVRKTIKIEKGNKATPFQPNLLQSPYNICANDVNKNLVDTRVYSNSNYLIGSFPINTPLSTGEKVTFTLKGTKLSTKQFGFYVQTATGTDTEFQGNLVPVEGLANTWSWTGNLKIAQTTTSTAKVAVYQLPPTSQVASGPVTIDWAKLEKGETFTPNIERFEYKGISSIETSPNNYYWSAEPFNRSIYSNSVDFENWDYTGNPNLSAKLNASSFSSGSGGTAVDDGDQIVFTLDGTKLTKYKVDTQTPLIHGKTYTISCEILLESDFVGDASNIKLQHTYLPGGQIVLQTTTRPSNTLSIWQKLQGTSTINYGSVTPQQWYSVLNNIGSNTITGHIRLRNVKIEAGPTPTPYQPNLLDAPYYLSKAPLGENIANKSTPFPINSSSYTLYSAKMQEPFVVGNTYTITLEGTKPSTQAFVVYGQAVEDYNYGSMKPVEGLKNTWSLTFTPSKVSQDFPTLLQIIQKPGATIGACTINWLKIEKGSVATPNIKEYKYKGFSVKPSNNPNDYEWSIDRQYGEKRLDKMVDTTDPQSIGGIKNFLETPLVKGKEVLYGDRLFEGFYGSGTLHTSFKTKTRLGVGGLVMDDQPRLPEPFEWNSGRWQATVIRDVTFYCEGTMYIDTGGNMGKYIYIANWKDEAQTQYASGNPAGMGIAADNGYWYRNLKDFSWIVSLKKGDKFSIGIELATDKEVWNIQIRTLHIKELIPPLE